MADTTQDPFASIGGGYQLPDGGWVPKDHPLAQQYGGGLPQPTTTTQPPPAPTNTYSPGDPSDPFASIGGGVQLGDGGWVPRDHPLAQQAPTSTPPGSSPTGSPTPTGAQAGQPATYLQQQSQNAQTYSRAPGAQPALSTANQGTQDVVRNSYLQQATQGTQIDRMDPNFRQQADAFAAGVERQKRNYLADRAEQLGPLQTGALRGESRMAAEKAGQAIGGFEAELVGRELSQRRSEIENSLKSLTGIINADQQAALQRELANLDAQMRRLGITSNEEVERARIALQELLGLKGIDLDYDRLAQQQGQFEDQLHFDMDKWEGSDPFFGF